MDIAMHDDSATGKTSDAEGEQERSGSRALSSFARVLTARILRAHADGPLTTSELEARLGWAAKASLRVATNNLCKLGALARVDHSLASGTNATELTEAGRGLLTVADMLEHWLSKSPFGPIALPDTAARGTIRALVAGWDSTIVRALAERPLSLADLSIQIGDHSYPALKRRLSSLRSANLVTPVNDGGRSRAHGATPWLRCAVGPLTAAARWERNHAKGETPGITRHEIEAALLLALPLVDLPQRVSGSCVLAAPAAPGGGEEVEQSALAAVSISVENGELVSCRSGANGTPTTWALGTPDAWLDAMIDGNCRELRLRGVDPDLVTALVEGLHGALFEDYSISTQI